MREHSESVPYGCWMLGMEQTHTFFSGTFIYYLWVYSTQPCGIFKAPLDTRPTLLCNRVINNINHTLIHTQEMHIESGTHRHRGHSPHIYFATIPRTTYSHMLAFPIYMKKIKFENDVWILCKGMLYTKDTESDETIWWYDGEWNKSFHLFAIVRDRNGRV